MRALGLALLLLGCDDDPAFDALTCSAEACDPACQVLLKSPPNPARSTCSPPGPICDYFLDGRMWEYTCSAKMHIECLGSCPDSGATD